MLNEILVAVYAAAILGWIGVTIYTVSVWRRSQLAMTKWFRRKAAEGLILHLIVGCLCFAIWLVLWIGPDSGAMRPQMDFWIPIVSIAFSGLMAWNGRWIEKHPEARGS